MEAYRPDASRVGALLLLAVLGAAATVACGSTGAASGRDDSSDGPPVDSTSTDGRSLDDAAGSADGGADATIGSDSAAIDASGDAPFGEAQPDAPVADGSFDAPDDGRHGCVVAVRDGGACDAPALGSVSAGVAS